MHMCTRASEFATPTPVNASNGWVRAPQMQPAPCMDCSKMGLCVHNFPASCTHPCIHLTQTVCTVCCIYTPFKMSVQQPRQTAQAMASHNTQTPPQLPQQHSSSITNTPPVPLAPGPRPSSLPANSPTVELGTAHARIAISLSSCAADPLGVNTQ